MNEQISSVDRVRRALTDAGLAPQIEEFPASTRTAQDAASAIGTSVGQIVKSLVFMAGEEPILALVSGSNQLDLERLGTLAGAPIRKADAGMVRAATSYAIGGVPPIGFPKPIRTVVDLDLLQYGTVWAAAGTPRHVFAIEPTTLVRVTAGTVAALKAESA